MARHAAGMDVATNFKKTLVAFRLYAGEHVKRKEASQELLAAVTRFVDGYEELELLVRPNALVLGEKPIITEDKPEESLTRPLFADGVQRLVFLRGITAEELEGFVQAWQACVEGRGADGAGFTTRMWEADPKGIRVDALDAISDAADPDDLDAVKQVEELDTLMDRMESDAPPSSRSPGGGSGGSGAGGSASGRASEADLELLKLDSLPELSLADFQDTKGPPRALGHGLEAPVAARLREGLARARDDVVTRTLVAVWHMLPMAMEEEQKELLGVVRSSLDLAVREERWKEVAAALRMVQEHAEREPERMPDLKDVLAVLSSPDILPAVVAPLDSEKSSSAVQELLALVPASAVEALLDQLPNLKTVPGRSGLLVQLSAKHPTAEMLLARLQRFPPTLAPALLALADTLSPEALTTVLYAALANPAPPVRLAALNRVRKEERPIPKPVLMRLSRDAEPSIRQALVAVCMRARDDESVLALANMAEWERVGPEERMTLVRALGAVGGAPASAALRRMFEEQKDTDMRCACALALGQMGDQGARSLLEGVAKKLFAGKQIKTACTEALKRLDAQKTPAGGTAP